MVPCVKDNAFLGWQNIVFFGVQRRVDSYGLPEKYQNFKSSQILIIATAIYLLKNCLYSKKCQSINQSVHESCNWNICRLASIYKRVYSVCRYACCRHSHACGCDKDQVTGTGQDRADNLQRSDRLCAQDLQRGGRLGLLEGNSR